MKALKYILLGMVIPLAVLVGFLVGQYFHKESPVEPPIIQVDTLYVRDTIKVTNPIFITKRVVDSILVPVKVPITIRDTIYVALEREQVTWQDSLSRIYASGIMPSVDSVIHFRENMIITKEIQVTKLKRSRWGIGIQASVGAGVGTQGFTPYVGIGVGVSYNLFSW